MGKIYERYIKNQVHEDLKNRMVFVCPEKNLITTP
jgi:hypothetical protein